MGVPADEAAAETPEHPDDYCAEDDEQMGPCEFIPVGGANEDWSFRVPLLIRLLVAFPGPGEASSATTRARIVGRACLEAQTTLDFCTEAARASFL